MLARRPQEDVVQGSPGAPCGMTRPGSLHVPAPWSAFSSEPVPRARAVVIALEAWAAGQWLQGKSHCRFLHKLPAGGWMGTVSEAWLCRRGHPHHHPGLARGPACAHVCCGSPAVTLSPGTLLAAPTSALRRTGGRSETRTVSPHPHSHLPFPRSCLIQFASPETAPHSLTINKWSWPEAWVTICMLNLLPPLPASWAPGTREPRRRCQHPAFGALRRAAKSQRCWCQFREKGAREPHTKSGL